MDPRVAILFEDPSLLAVDKPSGLVVIPARDEDPGLSLRHQLEGSRGERLWVVHRLDRGTSGVVLFARTAEAHRALCLAFEQHLVRKTYLAYTQGAPSPPEGDLTVALHTARRGKMRPALEGEPGALTSRTGYRVQRRWTTPSGVVARIEASPLTGRQHQVRVHLRWAGAPILGDALYGAPDARIGRLALHAARVELPHEGATLTLEAPLPADLVALEAALGAWDQA
ncbi:MAG: RluA family pseudouridine synthase [Deltaproteobacteria bacterium]|nr:RluA family pseudouridine synthase [Deltaproteobacteria bacterium]